MGGFHFAREFFVVLFSLKCASSPFNCEKTFCIRILQVPKGCFGSSKRTRINLKFSQRFQFWSKLVDMIKILVLVQNPNFCCVEDFDQDDIFFPNEGSQTTITILTKDFSSSKLQLLIKILMKPRKRIDDKIHSKSRTKPTISNLSPVFPVFFP